MKVAGSQPEILPTQHIGRLSDFIYERDANHASALGCSLPGVEVGSRMLDSRMLLRCDIQFDIMSAGAPCAGYLRGGVGFTVAEWGEQSSITARVDGETARGVPLQATVGIPRGFVSHGDGSGVGILP